MSRPTQIELPAKDPRELHNALYGGQFEFEVRTVVYELEPDRAQREVDAALVNWLGERGVDPGYLVLGRRTYWSLCAWAWGDEFGRWKTPDGRPLPPELERHRPGRPPWPYKIERFYSAEVLIDDERDWGVQLLPRRGKEQWG